MGGRVGMSDSSSDPDEEVLTVFRDVGDPHEPLTTREVADSLDCARRTAYNKLDSLAERDAIKTKKVGSRGRVWWLSEQVVSEKQQFRTGTSQPIEQAPIEALSSLAPPRLAFVHRAIGAV
jgi:predicted ArsR family transcriptional regulator